ncbi:MAG: ParB/RepB/Spo0J family partition protein [Lachnospiraceae bacterium]|nr:ParB/RepB/Spo0J family partition protein [Lachnospiraceae bacterium]
MKKQRPGEKIKLLTVDEMLGAPNEEGSVELRLDEIEPFRDHPFKVLDDEKMDDLVASIRQNGVLTPVLVRTQPDGKYEMISGHRRLHAARRAGLDTIPALIREIEDDDATIMMVDANLQREELLPSEKAFAYRMRYEAVKRKAGRPAGDGKVHNGRTVTIAEKNSSQNETNFCVRSDYELAEELGESRAQLQRYIRLTELIPELLELVDQKKIPLMTAVDISFIGTQTQKYLYEYIKENGMVKSYQVTALRKYLNDARSISQPELIKLLGSNVTGRNQTKNIILSEKKLQKYFKNNYSQADMEKILYRLLDKWLEEQSKS